MKSLLNFLTESLNNFSNFIKSKIQKNNSFFVENENYSDAKSVVDDLGYTAVDVYLDNMEAEDLEGILNNGKIIFPDWAKEIIDNKNKKFVVFFVDEEGKSDDKLMNTLIPIIFQREICGKKFDNFIPALVAPSLSNLPKQIQAKLK